MENKSTLFFQYLTELVPDWQKLMPDLLENFEELSLEEGEYLSIQRGDIYFLQSGTIGMYFKKTPQRYIQAREFILVPLTTRPIQFRVIEQCSVVLLDLSARYMIMRKYPSMIEVYDQFRSIQDKHADFRITILEIPKSRRLEKFQSKYGSLTFRLPRYELAQFLGISREYLRKLY